MTSTKSSARGRLIGRALVFGLLISLAFGLTAYAAKGVTFDKPGLITSAGQSSDASIVKVLINSKLKLGLDFKQVAKPEDLNGVKTLVVVVGASTKGLGAAGIDIDQEMDRTKQLLKVAREKKIKVLVMHTGGESRRGKTSNDVIELVVPDADYVVVVSTGNKDKFFNKLAEKKGIPVVEVDKIADAGEVIKGVFNAQ